MRFYVLTNPMTPAAMDAATDFHPIDAQRAVDAPRCAKCGEAIGMLPLMPPIRIELDLWGRRFGDVAFGPGNEILVSERFKNEFVTAGLSGFPAFMPVEVAMVNFRKRHIAEPVPRYFAAIPAQSRAALDERASGVIREVPVTCSECRNNGVERLDRIAFEPGTWSGEDIFFARGLPGIEIASERFKKLCDDHAFANCVLIDAMRFSFDDR